MNTVEIIATGFGLACVWLIIRRSIWCWPVGLVQVSLYIWVFYDAKLYSDAILHVIYVVLQVYGWIHWLRGGTGEDTLPIGRLSRHGAAGCSTIVLVGTVALGWSMYSFTDAALPFWDASIMVASLVAQFLLARKILENWLFWIGVDVVAIGVYAAKELYATTGLYSVFLCMAVAGWFAWRRSFLQQPARMPSAVEADLCSASSCHRTVGTSS
jgi:nicotinamide mononucleotide transporter